MRAVTSNAAALAAAVMVAASLGGCTTLSGGSADAFRELDFFADDIAALVFAVDVPVTLVPLAESSTIAFAAVTPSHGERRIEATLVRADADAVAGMLPPPGRDRAYYLFEFPAPVRDELREAQQWGRALEPGFEALGGVLSVTLRPTFCRSADIDASASTVSILVVTAGGDRLEPLLDRAAITQLLPSDEIVSLPRC